MRSKTQSTYNPCKIVIEFLRIVRTDGTMGARSRSLFKRRPAGIHGGTERKSGARQWKPFNIWNRQTQIVHQSRQRHSDKRTTRKPQYTSG